MYSLLQLVVAKTITNWIVSGDERYPCRIEFWTVIVEARSDILVKFHFWNTTEVPLIVRHIFAFGSKKFKVINSLVVR